MGEVYLAHDAKLGRDVALKLLLGRYPTDADRLSRFARETRAASALNHPNIVTVYDVDVDGDTQFIATEFIEGDTLRARLQQGRIPLGEALRIASQVADALAAAHSAGIIHRDIKPENILVRPDGYVKVVDFGLAKLGETTPDQDAVETRTGLETRAGVLVGTVAYMSPEQARGLSVDARTDLWSLGVVLYEMIAGRRPFAGPTSSDVIAMILQRDPPRLGTLAPEATAECELVLETALAKNPDERYQSARDLVNVLKRVQRHLDGGTETARTPAVVPEPRRKTPARVMLAFAAIVAVGGGYLAYRHLLRDRPAVPAQPFEQFQIARLTSSSNVLDAAISPDGRYVVHSVDNGPGQSLRVRHVNTSSNAEIVPSADVAYIGMTFSKDGAGADKSSAYSAQQVWRIPCPAGDPGAITKDLSNYSGVSITATGRALLTVQNSTAAQIWVGPKQDLDAASVVTSSRTTFEGRFGLSWTPDGRIVYSSAANGTFDAWIMNADGSGRRPITTNGGAELYPDVSVDGKTMVVTSDVGSNIFGIWRVEMDGTGLRPLTRDEGGWAAKTLPDGSVLFMTADRIWRMPLEGGTAVQMTNASTGRPAVSPDGTRFVCSYRQTVAARAQLAVYHVGEAEPRQLIDIPATADTQAQWGPDGRSLHYIDTRDGVSNIWSLSLSGGPARQVTRFKSERIFAFAWSRDGSKLALSRGSVASDAVLITSEK